MQRVAVYSLLLSVRPYCSQFDPSEGLGWTVVGFCRGSRAPTGSPVQYTGTCQFNKCVIEPEGGDPVPCVNGQQGCTCDSEGVCTKRPDLEICTLEDVEPFSSSAEYVEDDVVRIGTKRFKVCCMFICIHRFAVHLSVFLHMFINVTLTLPLLKIISWLAV